MSPPPDTPISPPVVLEWEPSELYNAQDSPELARQRAELQRLSQQTQSARNEPHGEAESSSGRRDSNTLTNQEMPPSYEAVRLPTTPVIYTFSPTKPRGSMLLLPPSTHPDSRPLYHIAAHLNPFVPTSAVTTVSRGPSGDGEEVGGFETGMGGSSGMMPVINFHDKGHPFDSVLAIVSWRNRSYVWRLPTIPLYLYWEYEASPYVCRLGSGTGKVLARFNPVGGTVIHNSRNPKTPATLEVLPPGFEHIDRIVVSVLAIEWWRVARRTEAFK